MRKILGISAFFHDSAAALVVDGHIIAAAQEERFTRRKNDDRFPARSIGYCLREAGLTLSDLDAVVFYDKPILKFVRSVETWLTVAPQGVRSFVDVLPQWVGGRLNIEGTIRDELPGLQKKCPVLFTTHHQAHAASAFYPSPFAKAAILTVDGVGEYATTTIARGDGAQIELLDELRFPHSVGLLYSAFTAYCGFQVNSGEYKLMGLAPYGEPTHVALIRDHLIDLRPDGSFRLNLDYFGFLGGQVMTSDRFHRLFGGSPRAPESPLEPRHLDLARSIQAVTEEVLLNLARRARERTGLSHLCMAGGVALNCVANGHILRSRIFDDLWIQPAAGDAGAALGAALVAWHDTGSGPPRTRVPMAADSMRGSLLGPAYSDAEIEQSLLGAGAVFDRLPMASIVPRTAELLAEQRVVGWFQGRMEFGPRALGSRSILGDARSPAMQSVMNLKIKFRESFRPFAPIVPVEQVSEYFQLDRPSPYMLIVAKVVDILRRPVPVEAKGLKRLIHPHSTIPAVTHVDYSARVQTVDASVHPRLHQLLTEFGRLTGCPILVNTSFNVRDEPIVESPLDAYRCFLKTEMDVLVMGSFLLWRDQQPKIKDDTLKGAKPTRFSLPEPPPLKDRPSEWRKFALIWSLAAVLLTGLLFRKGQISRSSKELVLAIVVPLLAFALVRPSIARWPYRWVMTGAFYLGWPLRTLLLHLFYLIVLTPFALVVRMSGRSPLELKPELAQGTFWKRPPALRGLHRPS